jgi:hypothetical protein
MALDVLGWCHRRGELHLTLVLPDGTRALIPAAWTNLHAPPPSSRGGPQAQSATLANRSHLLHARTVVNALLQRLEARDTALPIPQEMSHAAAELSRNSPTERRCTRVDHARRGTARRRGHEAGTTDGQHHCPHPRRVPR